MLLKHFELSEEDCKKTISDRHLEKISRSCSLNLRSLTPFLGLPPIVGDNIDRSSQNQESKRLNFLNQWKQIKGSDATYFQLIRALLEIQHRQDAETTCKILKDSMKFSTMESTKGNLEYCLTTWMIHTFFLRAEISIL